MDRVLSSFRLNPYDVLEVPLEGTTATIQRTYRKKSLLIHPDKIKSESLRPRAIEAFDLLKKASTHLLDEDRRRNLDETVLSAKFSVLRDELRLPTHLSSDSEQIRALNLNPSFEERVRKQTRELMIDDEVRKRKLLKMQHAMEGEEQRKKEAELNERKRKAEEKVQWEETRDERVKGWRAFAGVGGSSSGPPNGRKKKKGSKDASGPLGNVNVLG